MEYIIVGVGDCDRTFRKLFELLILGSNLILNVVSVPMVTHKHKLKKGVPQKGHSFLKENDYFNRLVCKQKKMTFYIFPNPH